MPKCERSGKECDILHVAPDSPADKQIAVCPEEYVKAFKKVYPNEPIPAGFEQYDVKEVTTPTEASV